MDDLTYKANEVKFFVELSHDFMSQSLEVSYLLGAALWSLDGLWEFVERRFEGYPWFDDWRATALGQLASDPVTAMLKRRRNLYTHWEPPSIHGVLKVQREDGTSVLRVENGKRTLLAGTMPAAGERVVEAKYYFGRSSPEHGIDPSYTIGWCETPEAFVGPVPCGTTAHEAIAQALQAILEAIERAEAMLAGPSANT